MPKYSYGWVADKPDFRDQKLSLPVPLKANPVPVVVDLAPGMPGLFDQGQLGSCTANAIAAAIMFDQKKQNLPLVMPSRLFVYYNERALEGTTKSDSGAQIRDGIKTINQTGYADEKLWPYVISRFTKKPPLKAYQDAQKRKALQYQAVVHTEAFVKQTLAVGLPIVIGIAVYESFEGEDVAKTGVVPMPQQSESMLGGHCIVLVGYDANKRLFKFRNSWGDSWGAGGYGFLPFDYVLNTGLAQDFWVINSVS